MKLLSYRSSGENTWGVLLEDGGIVEGRTLLDGTCASIRQVLAGNRLAEISQEVQVATAGLQLDDLELLPVISDAEKIFCAGLNYRSHIEETGRTPPEFPRFFARVPNSMVGHGAPMIRPKASTMFDYEGELALVIGKRGRHIAEEDALKHVAGYTCFMDGSLRDYQEHTTTSGKNFHATGPLGPWMVTADEIPDPTRLTLTTRLNGQVVQHATTDMLIYSIARMISYLSTITYLEPGDVIATGTPEGVGQRRTPQLWLKPGDVIEVDISGIGVLRNPIHDEE